MRVKRRGGFLLLVLMLSASGCKKNPASPAPVIPSLPNAPGTVLLFDDFDAENNGAGIFNWTGFRNWDVVAGCVDLHGNGFFDVQAGNGLYVDLDGTCNAGGTIESKATLSLTQGTRYVLEFWLAGNQRVDTPDTVLVSLGGVYSEQIVLNRGDQFRLFTRNLLAASNAQAKLRFQNLGHDHQGALLDLVRLRRLD